MGTCGHGTWAMSHVPMPPCPMSPCHAPCGTPACHNAQRTTHTPIMWFPTLDPSRLPRVIATTIQRRLDMAHGDMGTWDMGTWGHVTWGHGTWDMDVAVYGIRVHRRAALTHEAQHHLTPLRAALSRVEFWNPGIQGPGSMAGSRDQPPAACDPCPMPSVSNY